MSVAKKDSVDLQTFVNLLTEHQGPIRSFIVSLMPGNPDVGDVLQETNLVLWKKRDRFEKGTNFQSWAFTVAKYEVLHYRDRVKRADRVLLSEDVSNMFAEEEQEEGPKLHEGYLQALDQCMGKLPREHRKLVEYRYRSGHSLEQFATQTGASSGSLRIALLRIRKALRRCIEKNLLKGQA